MTRRVTKAVGLVVWPVMFVSLLFIGNVQAQPLVNIETVTVGDPTKSLLRIL